MAWIEEEPWLIEQGVDALKVFELYSNPEQTIPWTFVGWDVNGTISDDKGRSVRSIEIETNPSGGIVRLILPEAIANTLKPGIRYRYDVLMIPPGTTLADDNFLATGPLTVALRTSRRDP